MPAQFGGYDTLRSVAGKVFTYLSTITLTGTDGKTITMTQDTSLDEAVAMSSKLAIPGAWTTPAFDAADFTATGSMTWTVAAGDLSTYAYIILGKIMTVSFWIDSSTVAGTPSYGLCIEIPVSKTATKTMAVGINIRDASAYSAGYANVNAGGTVIICNRIDNANWTASTNDTAVRGTITFEIN